MLSKKFIIVTVFFFAWFYTMAAENIMPPQAINGVIDLRNYDIDKTPIALNGQWSFYWKQIIDPSQKINTTTYTQFPKRWNTVVNSNIPAQGYASYALTVLLPHNKNELALTVPDVYTSYRLFINGKLFSYNGKVDSVAANYLPYWATQTLALHEETDTLHLVLQIANFSHSKGGPYKEIIIGNKSTLLLTREKSLAGDFLMCGCLFMGGLFFFSLYLFGKHDKATLFFSLFCMMYSYRVIGSSFYALHSVFPNISWEITVRLEYFTLFEGVVFFLQYINKLYPKDIYKPLSLFFLGLYIFASLISILTKPIFFTNLINPFLFSMFFCIAYILFVFIKAIIKKRIGSIYALISIAVLMLVILLINLEYFGVVHLSKTPIFFCYLAFFFLQSLILSFRFAHKLNTAKSEAEQGMRAKGEFLSTMSHEIRTPLNSVIGMSHLLLRNNPREDQKEQMEVMLFSANNLLAIVNDILDYSKIEAGKISFEHIEMDIRTIAKNTISSLQNIANEKAIDLRVQIDDALQQKVMGDPTRLSQIISNLVHNAIKFTNKGWVAFTVDVQQQNAESITIKFAVEDTGIGIAEEKQRAIFDQFTQADSSTSRSFGGTGLGLTICKQILALQGSALKLISKEGKGSTFYFEQTFKISNTVTTGILENSNLPKEEDKPFTNISILLVEDNLMNVMVAESFLKRWGANVDVAYNGKEALEKLDISKHKLILMDMHMPIMDGYEATRKMRAAGITLPIIALTASLPKEVEEQIKETGIDNIVVKPFVPDYLFKMLLAYIDIDTKDA